MIRFDEFVDWALYGPDGFYTVSGNAGRRRGDFITSPEIGPLFGAVVANFLDAEWERLGRPQEFTFVDVGAGPGTLARSILAAQPRCAGALRYVAVETSAQQRDQHPDRIESLAEMPTDRLTGVILANELLDNLPFRLAVFDGQWHEAWVEQGDDDSGNRRYLERLTPLDSVPSYLPARAPHGARAPLIEQARRWTENAIATLEKGTVIVIDYGVGRTAELILRSWREWLRTYRGHQRGDHYLAAPGSQDITIDVPLDQLPPTPQVRTQSQWLQLHGIADLVEEGRQYWHAHAADPDLTAMKMRSRISESEALLAAGALGDFLVCEWKV